MSIVVICGCTHIHNIGAMSDEEFKYFEERGEKRSFVIRTFDGRIYEGSNLIIEQDKISWINLRGDGRVYASVDDIYQVVFETGGFGEGFGTGFVIGASIGGVLGFIGGEDCGETSQFCISRGGGAFVGVLFVGIPAGLIGGIVGSVKGSKHIYCSSRHDTTGVHQKPENIDVLRPSN
jgi:hypothetical protein